MVYGTVQGVPDGEKVYVENLGCAKNQVDAEVMLKRLADDGFERTDDAKKPM